MTNKPIANYPLLFLVIFSATIFLITPGTSSAEDHLSLFYGDQFLSTPRRQSTPFNNNVSLNDNGDLVIRYGRGSITMAYSPPEDETVKLKNVAFASTNQEYQAISGISVRLSLAF